LNVKLSYQGTPIHRIIRDHFIQGGDIVKGDGTGVESIYGGFFPDETFKISHSRAFLLSSANSGPNTNHSQFFITTSPAPDLDGRNVVFGECVEGQDVVRNIEAQKVVDKKTYKPISPVVIVACGELKNEDEKQTKKKSKKEKKKKSKEQKSSDSSNSEVWSVSSSASDSENSGEDNKKSKKKRKHKKKGKKKEKSKKKKEPNAKEKKNPVRTRSTIPRDHD